MVGFCRSQQLTLDAPGIIEGTDKTSLKNNYLNYYEKALTPYRGMPINVFEIGVFQGASLKVWEAFFSEATIVGIDHNPNCKRFEHERSIVRIGSQFDPEFLSRVAAEFLPTIIASPPVIARPVGPKQSPACRADGGSSRRRLLRRFAPRNDRTRRCLTLQRFRIISEH